MPMLTLTGRVESHVSKSNKFLSFAQFSHLLLPPALVSVHPSWWLSSESVEMPSAVRTDGVRPVRQSDVVTLIREAALQTNIFCAASGFAAARVLKSCVKWAESCIGFLQKYRKSKIAAYFREIFEEFWENSEARSLWNLHLLDCRVFRRRGWRRWLGYHCFSWRFSNFSGFPKPRISRTSGTFGFFQNCFAGFRTPQIDLVLFRKFRKQSLALEHFLRFCYAHRSSSLSIPAFRSRFPELSGPSSKSLDRKWTKISPTRHQNRILISAKIDLKN